jgi:hypothetical protein
MADRDAKGRYLKGNAAVHPGRPVGLMLDPEGRHKITSYIRAGSFDWVAARAVGIPPQTFYNWMDRGAKGESQFTQFFEEVQNARAEARLAREVEVARTIPLAWLRMGPGRDRPGEPGWTDRPSGTELPHVTIIVTNSWRVE